MLYTEPEVVKAGTEVAVFYNPRDTPLAGKPRIFLQGGWNRWSHVRKFGPIEMTPPAEGGLHFKVGRRGGGRGGAMGLHFKVWATTCTGQGPGPSPPSSPLTPPLISAPGMVKVPLDAYIMDFVSSPTSIPPLRLPPSPRLVPALTPVPSVLQAMVKVPLDAYKMDFVFSDVESGEGTYDSRGGYDYHLPIEESAVRAPASLQYFRPHLPTPLLQPAAPLMGHGLRFANPTCRSKSPFTYAPFPPFPRPLYTAVPLTPVPSCRSASLACTSPTSQWRWRLWPR